MLSTLSSSISNIFSKYYISPLDTLLECKPFSFKDPSSRQALIGTINALLISATFYFTLGAINKTDQPLSSVLSGSMIPCMHRGDILILSKNVGKSISAVVSETKASSSNDDDDDN